MIAVTDALTTALTDGLTTAVTAALTVAFSRSLTAVLSGTLANNLTPLTAHALTSCLRSALLLPDLFERHLRRRIGRNILLRCTGVRALCIQPHHGFDQLGFAHGRTAFNSAHFCNLAQLFDLQGFIFFHCHLILHKNLHAPDTTKQFRNASAFLPRRAGCKAPSSLRDEE